MRIMGSFGGARSFGRAGVVIPPKPTIVSVTDVGTGRAFDDGALTITVAPDPSGPTPDFYNAWVIDPQGGERGVGSSSSTTFTATGLKTNTAYTVKVVSVVNFTASDFAIYNTPTTVTTVPASPTIGTATDVGIGRQINDAAASVTFTAGATGGKAQTFKVYSTDTIQRGTGSSSPITATGMDIQYGSKTRSFRVRGVNANGESAFSGDTPEITLTSAPSGPAISVTSTSGTTVNFSFYVPDDGGKPVSSTRVYVMSGGVELASTTVASSSGTGSLSLPEITGTSYIWAQATNANGAGGFGIGNPFIEPSAAPTFSVSRPNATTAGVTITNYNAAYTYSVSSASGAVTRSGDTITITGTTSSSFDVSVTVNQGDFYINRTATATIPSSSTPGTVNNIQVTDYGLGLISLSWDSVFGAVSYRVALTGAGGMTENTDTNGISFDGLSVGTTYSVVVDAYTGANATGTKIATGSYNFTLASTPTPTPTPTPTQTCPPGYSVIDVNGQFCCYDDENGGYYCL